MRVFLYTSADFSAVEEYVRSIGTARQTPRAVLPTGILRKGRVQAYPILLVCCVLCVSKLPEAKRDYGGNPAHTEATEANLGIYRREEATNPDNC